MCVHVLDVQEIQKNVGDWDTGDIIIVIVQNQQYFQQWQWKH